MFHDKQCRLWQDAPYVCKYHVCSYLFKIPTIKAFIISITRSNVLCFLSFFLILYYYSAFGGLKHYFKWHIVWNIKLLHDTNICYDSSFSITGISKPIFRDICIINPHLCWSSCGFLKKKTKTLLYMYSAKTKLNNVIITCYITH